MMADSIGDNSDLDDDGDGVGDGMRLICNVPSTDYDSDGCQDATEDSDDDNDLITDNLDDCNFGDMDIFLFNRHGRRWVQRFF